MVKTLTIECPHCKQVSQIYLSTNACVIVLNCPSCLAPIMYFDQKIFMLTPTQVDAIRNSSQDAAVMRLLQKIVKTENPAGDEKYHFVPQYSVAHSEESRMSLVPAARSGPEKYISQDDITNLRIELELCKDSMQFITQL